MDEKTQISGLKFVKPEAHTRPIPPNPMEETIHTVFEQDLARVSNNELLVNADTRNRVD